MAATASCASSGLQLGAGISRRVAPNRGLPRLIPQLCIGPVARKDAAAGRVSRRAAVAVRAQASASTATGTIPVSIVVPECRLAFGEGMKLVGGCPQMGDWSLEAGAGLTWQEGDNWSCQLDLPAGSYDFKLVITKADGGSYWEEGDNRSISVAQQPAGIPVSATCRFGDTSATAVAGDAQVAPAALQVSSAAARAGSAAGRNGSAAAAAGAGLNGASKAAQLAAQAVKAAEQQPEVAAEAEQLQAAVDAAAQRVADLDRRKDELAAKLDSLQQDMETKLDIKMDRSPSPPPPKAAAAAPAKLPAAQPPKPAAALSPAAASPASSRPADAQQVESGWLFKASSADRPGTAAFASGEPAPSSSSTGIVTLFLLPLLVPMCLGIYVSLQAAFPELHLPPLNLKEYQGYADQLLKYVSTSGSALSEQLASLTAAAQKAGAGSLSAVQQAATQLGEASKGAAGAMSDAVGQASSAVGQASSAVGKQAAAAADAAKQVQLPAAK